MVLKPEPLFDAVESVLRNETGGKTEETEVVVLSASGRRFTQSEALRLSKASRVILICGRYEGIDERVVEHLATTELSVGDFVLSGGEIGAVLIVDAVARYVPGVVGRDSVGTRFPIRLRWNRRWSIRITRGPLNSEGGACRTS
jgi:tRNA (guanine37-N1)-methyltransferase